MESKVEKLKDSKVKLTIIVPAAEMLRYFRSAYNELAPSVKISGFRPGKAPRKMIESGLGISKISSLAIDSALNANYRQAVIDNKLMPLAEPKIAVDKFSEYGLELEEIKTDFKYTAEVEVFPEVELGDYSKLKVIDKGIEKVKEDDVKKILDHLRRQKATFKEIDRKAKKGDFTEISFEGFDKKVKKDALSSKHHPLVLGEGSLIPGFEDNIIGLQKGEEKEFKIRFPKDYHSKEYADREIEFKAKLENLKEVILPELDDKFAEDFGRKDMADLKKGIEQSLKDEIAHKHEHEIEGQVVEKLLPLLKAEIPETLIERETDNVIEGFKTQLKSQGLDFDAYMQSMKKDEAALRKDLRAQAEKNVRIGLMLGAVIKEQKMDEKDNEAGRKALHYLVKKLTAK